MFVIKCISGKFRGWYVARKGQICSYSKYLQSAQKYPSRDSADKDRCINNEIVLEANDE